MTEKQLEQKLVDAVKNFGGMAYKFTSPGHNGVPDRLVILPIAKASNGAVLSHFGFVEVKKPGAGELSALQELELKRLTGYGANCYVLDDPKQIDSIIKDIKTGWNPNIRYGI